MAAHRTKMPTASAVISANGGDSDSDLDDDEYERLRQAVDVSLENTFADKDKDPQSTNKNAERIVKPSLRPVEKTNEEFNELDTTPEFRSFVAKKLSEILDRQIKESKASPKEVGDDGESKNLFKVFSSSKEEVPKKEPVKPSKRKVTGTESSSEDEDYSKFACVAVSGSDIIDNGLPLVNECTEEDAQKKKKKKKDKKRIDCVNGEDNKTDTNGRDISSERANGHKKKKKKKRKKSE